MPAARNRSRHRYTVGRLMPHPRAIALMGVPSAAARTIRARATTRCGVLPLRTNASRSARCAALTVNAVAGFHMRASIARRWTIGRILTLHYTSSPFMVR